MKQRSKQSLQQTLWGDLETDQRTKEQRYKAEYCIKHRDKIKLQKQKYHAEHRDEAMARQRRYRTEHREECQIKWKKRNAEYYARHRAEEIARKKKYQAEHPEKSKIHARNYRIKNLEKVKARERKYRAATREHRSRMAREYRVKNAAKLREYSIKTRDQRHARHLRTRFGTEAPSHYAAQLAKQNGECAVCRTIPKGRLHLDHNHKTGQLRALLCHSCNSALGMCNDSAEWLRKVADYVELWGQEKAA